MHGTKQASPSGGDASVRHAERRRSMRSAALVAALAVLAAHSNASAQPMPPEWRAPVFRGRVVDGDGDGIGRARVRALAHPLNGGGRPRVLGEGRTAANGTFSVRTRRLPVGFTHQIVVDLQGVRRTILPPTTRDLVIPMSPTRLVTIEVRCHEVLDSAGVASSGGRMLPPLLEVRWGDGRWLHAYMRAAGPSPPPRLEVIDAADLAFVPAETRDFAVRVAMPIGRSDVGIAGPCGFAAQTVDVPAGEEPIPPVRIELSSQGTGTLVVGGAHFAGGVMLAFGDLTVGGYRIGPVHAVEVTGLPPGRYRLIGPPPCRREVEVVAGRRTSLELGDQDQCVIRRDGPPR